MYMPITRGRPAMVSRHAWDVPSDTKPASSPQRWGLRRRVAQLTYWRLLAPVGTTQRSTAVVSRDVCAVAYLSRQIRTCVSFRSRNARGRRKAAQATTRRPVSTKGHRTNCPGGGACRDCASVMRVLAFPFAASAGSAYGSPATCQRCGMTVCCVEQCQEKCQRRRCPATPALLTQS